MNIVFVSLDTLRASRLGCYGYGKPTSPYLDSIAAQGALFERAYATDIPTEVAHTGIFTGKMGLSTGIVSHGSPLTQLPKKEPWLPALLRSHGFTTGAVDNLYQLKEWFARGYRYYINSVGNKRNIDGRTVNELAFPWIREHKDEPFFFCFCTTGIRIPRICRRMLTPASFTRRGATRTTVPIKVWKLHTIMRLIRFF